MPSGLMVSRTRASVSAITGSALAGALVRRPSQVPTQVEVSAQPASPSSTIAQIAATVIIRDMPAIEPDVYLSMGLSESEFERIVGLLGREPSYTELGMFAVMWSEHCGYKFSRPVLSYFKQYKEALEGEGLENAGIVDIGGGLGVVMKVESHNHPSAVEPYEGAATGVGGIIRDIFTMGARPIASLNSLRFGPIEEGKAAPEVVQRNRFLFEGVVAGIAGYGNCVGVPTVAGEVAFHPRYSGNPLVNAMSVGIVPLDGVATAGANGIGNPVIYLGSATGKDGIHGATFASDTLGEDNEEKRPNVQIGDPFAEKLLIEATLEALKTGAVAAIQDMGAAGLTCSTVEMSSKGKVGMTIDLDLVPMRESDMSAYELMLSESQERMLAVSHPGREQEVIDVFHKWGINAVVIGKVTDDGMVRVFRGGKLEAEAPALYFTDECPAYQLPLEEPEYFRKAAAYRVAGVAQAEPKEALLKLVSSPDLASKRWVFQQYDQQVQTQTSLTPGGGDAAVLAPRGTQKGLSLKIDGSGRWTYLHPYIGGLLAVTESARNVACTGGRPQAITDGLNFGNPQHPHVYWQFERAVRGIADAAEAMATPVISGNVSFYNQSDLGEVLPTPVIGMLGVMEHASDRVGMGLPQGKGAIGLIWYDVKLDANEGLGASQYLADVRGVENGQPLAPDLAKEKALCGALADLAEGRLANCMHDLSEGGLAVALAEMALTTGVGAKVDVPSEAFQGATRTDAKLFGEVPGRVLVGFDPKDEAAIRSKLPEGLRFAVLGAYDAGTTDVTVCDGGKAVLTVGVDALKAAYEGAIPSLMAH